VCSKTFPSAPLAWKFARRLDHGPQQIVLLRFTERCGMRHHLMLGINRGHSVVALDDTMTGCHLCALVIGELALLELPAFARPNCQLSMVTMCAWILPSTAPRPNRLAIASAAMPVASPSREASRASISFLSGVL
jgi:hypothetical protein